MISAGGGQDGVLLADLEGDAARVQDPVLRGPEQRAASD